MKFKYLGTAAAEGWPAVFCNCLHCRRAAEKGGRNIRTRSNALVNKDLMLDFPPDTYSHALTHSIDLSAVKYLLVTHSHMDHFAPNELNYRSKSYYAHDLTEEFMYLYANEKVLEDFAENRRVKNEPKDQNIITTLITPYKPVDLGKYTITALRASHALKENAYNYLISQEDKNLLYFHDTGKLYDDVYDYLTANKIKAHIVSLDCTYGLLKCDSGHMGLEACNTEKEKMLSKGIADQNTIFVVNHFSHNGGAIYDEMCVEAEKYGFLTSYDGMELEM